MFKFFCVQTDKHSNGKTDWKNNNKLYTPDLSMWGHEKRKVAPSILGNK